MDRTELIRHHLSTFILRDLGCAVVNPDAQAWTTFDLPGHFRFGWMMPFAIDDNPMTLLVSFCPEILDSVTTWLDDNRLDVYLSVIERYLDAYIACFGDPEDEIVRAVEADLYETAPEALALLSLVEAKALDAVSTT